MNQSEIDKIIYNNVKSIGKASGWKFSSGFLFKKSSNLFFIILINCGKKPARLFSNISVKWFDFDNLFWDIVKMPENKKRPLSFHANGAWTVSTSDIVNECFEIDDINLFDFANQIDIVICEYNKKVDELSHAINSIDLYVDLMRELHIQHKKQYPGSLLNIDMHELFVFILKKDINNSLNLINNKIAAGDNGGFCIESKSFYEYAKEYVINDL